MRKSSSRSAVAVPAVPNHPTQYIKVQEAANRLGVSKHTIYKWVSLAPYAGNDPIPHCHFSKRCLRFPLDELLAWAARREMVAA